MGTEGTETCLVMKTLLLSGKGSSGLADLEAGAQRLASPLGRGEEGTFECSGQGRPPPPCSTLGTFQTSRAGCFSSASRDLLYALAVGTAGSGATLTQAGRREHLPQDQIHTLVITLKREGSVPGPHVPDSGSHVSLELSGHNEGASSWNQ